MAAGELRKALSHNGREAGDGQGREYLDNQGQQLVYQCKIKDSKGVLHQRELRWSVVDEATVFIIN